MNPTGDPSPREPSDNVTVRSDSAVPILAVGDEESGNLSDQATDIMPGWPRDPSKRRGVEAPPAAFGRYRVEHPLGAGGFGAVYLCRDTQLDRPVAVKVLHGDPGSSQAPGERFLQEARRLAQLSHPGIVSVHDVGREDGRVYIVSDYLEGPDLARWLEGRRPSWQESARTAAAVADALSHAHARMIVHRDVKPGNVIMTLDRGPVLVDFGLGLDEARAGRSELGTVTGSPAYMAPEQVAGVAHRIDGRTDIYSLGVVLYEMLCGRLPFRASGARELLRQVRDDEPQPPRQLRPEIPPELERACLKALAKRLRDRYTTASDFAEDLRRACPPSAIVPACEGQAPAPAPVSPRPSRASASSGGARARDAERRQVTVLVCGCALFESEGYLEGLDAEGQAGVMRTFTRACERAVRERAGAVVQCGGEGIVACFGYPVAFEDAAQRAVRAGLAILEELNAEGERFGREHGLAWDPWAGLHTGPAVVEAGEDSVSLAGEARNVAIRLKDFAEPGRIVCSGATHRLIRVQFDCKGLGHRRIKGLRRPVELFLVEGVGPARSAVEAAGPSALTPLTGRDHEVALLKDRWERAQEGMGQVVLLVGEPGLGKSRLVYTLKEHVLGGRAGGEADAPVIEWRCAPHYQDSGLHPAIDFYERALGFGREESPSARFERLLGRLERDGLDRPEAVPLWASLLSLPAPGRFRATSLPPTKQRAETFRLIREWLYTRADRGPLLFIVEDLHWADASTLEFLGQFFAEGQYDSILTVLTCRPEFEPPWPTSSHQTSLALGRLTRRQAGEMMRRMTGGPLDGALVEQVHDRAGGVPLFVEEFMKVVQESGAPEGGGSGGAGPEYWPGREIPATLQDLLMARLDRMEGDRDVAQLAATLGREFSDELLEAVAGPDGPALEDELAKLVRAGILHAKGRPPRRHYTFKHVLLVDALYNALVKGKRQQFHARIAEALASRFPQTTATQPELVAHHLTEAGLAEDAIGYWLKAGLRSRERSAEKEAIGHLTRGLALLATLDESPARDSRELELSGALGTAYIASRGYAAPEVGAVFRRARELCERLGHSPRLVATIVGIWEWHFVRGEMRACTELVAEAEALARPLDDPGAMMEALYTAGQTMLYRADFAGARDRFAAAVADFDDRGRNASWSVQTGHHAGVNIRCNLAVSLWHLGYPDQASRVDRGARELAREIGHPFGVAYALHHTSWLHLFCRLGDEVREASEAQVDLAAEQGFALWHATGMFFRGAGILLQGRPREAIPLLLKGHEDFRATGAEILRPLLLGALGEAYTRADRFEEAGSALDEGLALSEKNDDRIQEAELHRLKGELLLAEARGQEDAAEGRFTRAIETARRQRSRAWELRASMSLARLWRRQGRREEALAALETVFGTYTEGFTTPDLVEARALRDALAAASGGGRRGPAG